MSDFLEFKVSRPREPVVTLAGSTVLIVDDEPVLNRTMGLVLRREGATVLSAAHGAEALALLQQHRVDAMVCDQNMPVMDGRTLLQTLYERGIAVRSLFFVSNVEREDVAHLSAIGVRRTISKPIQPMVLIEAVAGVLAEG